MVLSKEPNPFSRMWPQRADTTPTSPSLILVKSHSEKRPKANTCEIFELCLKRPKGHLWTRLTWSILWSTHLLPQTNTRERGWGGEGDLGRWSSDSAVNRTRLLKQQQQQQQNPKQKCLDRIDQKDCLWNVTAHCSDCNNTTLFLQLQCEKEFVASWFKRKTVFWTCKKTSCKSFNGSIC